MSSTSPEKPLTQVNFLTNLITHAIYLIWWEESHSLTAKAHKLFTSLSMMMS